MGTVIARFPPDGRDVLQAVSTYFGYGSRRARVRVYAGPGTGGEAALVGEVAMTLLLWIGGLLLLGWLVAWLAFEVAGAVVHLLLVAAAVLIIWGLLKRARAAA
jgi:hypothetical protein